MFQGVPHIARLKQQHLSFTFINVLTKTFEVMKKENSAEVLRLLTDANLKNLLY